MLLNPASFMLFIDLSMSLIPASKLFFRETIYADWWGREFVEGMSDGVGRCSLLRCSRTETYILEVYFLPVPTSDKYCLVPNLSVYFDKFWGTRNHVPRHIFLQASTFWSESRNYSKCSIICKECIQIFQKLRVCENGTFFKIKK